MKLLLITTLLSLTAGCKINVFEPFDGPSDDAQYQSIAQACFDEGDLECAKEFYEKLSDASKDVKNSGLVFVSLEEQGIDMEVFMAAIGSGGSGGEIITRMADRLAGDGPSEAKRSKIGDTFTLITDLKIPTVELRGLARFAASTALVAMMFAEVAGADNRVDKNDVIDGWTQACEDALTCTLNETNIANGTGASIDLTNSGGAAVTGAINMDKIHKAFTEMNRALNNEIAASGKFGGGNASLSETLENNPPTNSLKSDLYITLLSGDGLGHK